MRILLHYNPSAGQGRTSPEALRRAFVEAGFTVVRHAQVLDDAADAPPFDLAVIAGGDGTVAEAVDRLRGRARLFSIVPLGTANNIATALGIRGTAEEIARGLRQGAERSVDIGRVSGLEEPRWFVEAVGLGALADSLAENKGRDLSGPEKLRAGRESLLRNLPDAAPGRFGAKVDGQPLPDELLLIEVLKFSVSGSRLRLAPSAEPGDGILDAAFLRPEGRAGLIAALEADPEGPLPLEVVRGRRVELTWADRLLRIDDEFLAPPPAPRKLSIALSEAPVRFLVPARTGG